MRGRHILRRLILPCCLVWMGSIEEAENPAGRASPPAPLRFTECELSLKTLHRPSFLSRISHLSHYLFHYILKLRKIVFKGKVSYSKLFESYRKKVKVHLRQQETKEKILFDLCASLIDVCNGFYS